MSAWDMIVTPVAFNEAQACPPGIWVARAYTALTTDAASMRPRRVRLGYGFGDERSIKATDALCFNEAQACPPGIWSAATGRASSRGLQ